MDSIPDSDIVKKIARVCKETSSLGEKRTWPCWNASERVKWMEKELLTSLQPGWLLDGH